MFTCGSVIDIVYPSLMITIEWSQVQMQMYNFPSHCVAFYFIAKFHLKNGFISIETLDNFLKVNENILFSSSA